MFDTTVGDQLTASQTHSPEKVILVNKKEFKVSQDSLTGEQILALAGYAVNQYDLFLVHGQSSQKIEPSQQVEIKNGLHFNAILKSVPYG